MAELEVAAPSLIARMRQLSARYFVDREVFLRSNDKVRYLRVSARAQKLCAGVAVVTGCWLAYTTLAFFLSTYLERAKDAEIAQHRLAYFDLLSEVSEYQGQFGQITRNLQENQEYLLSLVGSDQSGLDPELADNLKSSETEYARVAVARDSLRERLQTFEGELQEIASKNGDLQRKVATLKETLLSTEAERVEVTAARERLGRRLQQTEQELALASTSKTELETRVRTLLAELESERATREQLAAARAQLESELTGQTSLAAAILENQRAAYEATIAGQRESYEAKIAGDGELYATTLAEQRAAYEATIAGDGARYATTLAEQRAAYEAQIAGDRERYETTLSAQREGYETALAEQQASYEAQLAGLGSELDLAQQQTAALHGQIDTIESALTRALDRGEALAGQRDQLEAQLGGLESLIAEMRDQQKELVDRVVVRTLDNITDLEDLVAETGLDVEYVLAKVEGYGLAQGGPFIPADELLDSDASYELQVSVAMLDLRLDRWDALQLLVQSLPMATPMEHYEITSDFGYRRDPLNGRSALHTGLDFGAPRNTPLYTTGPGVVTFAGWRGRYGRVVEVDHGFGIKTRYAHLAKISVKKGQEVVLGDEIGLLGTSGRSTGPHVHYEVLFEGKPYDPMNFIKAGKDVL